MFDQLLPAFAKLRPPISCSDSTLAARKQGGWRWFPTPASGSPDLVAGFDYFRFQRPQVPSALGGRAFSNPAQVSDAELLGFLGETTE